MHLTEFNFGWILAPFAWAYAISMLLKCTYHKGLIIAFWIALGIALLSCSVEFA